METTKIGLEQTVAEIQKILGKYGVGAVMTEYDKGEVIALNFRIRISDKNIPFRLTSRWEPIHEVLSSRYARDPRKADLISQAKRVSWRQTLRWIEASLAYAGTSMVKFQQLLMGFIQVDIKGQTLYEKLEQKGLLGLEDKR